MKDAAITLSIIASFTIIGGMPSFFRLMQICSVPNTSEQKWLWVVILLLAYRSPVPNQLYIDKDIPINEQDLANEAAIPIETLHKHLEVITSLNMLVKKNDTFLILNYKPQTTLNPRTHTEHTDPEPTGELSKAPPEITADDLEIATSMGYTPEEWLALKQKD